MSEVKIVCGDEELVIGDVLDTVVVYSKDNKDNEIWFQTRCKDYYKKEHTEEGYENMIVIEFDKRFWKNKDVLKQVEDKFGIDKVVDL